jgi:hypothetical protein
MKVFVAAVQRKRFNDQVTDEMPGKLSMLRERGILGINHSG